MSWNGPDFFEYTIESDDTLWDLADEFELSVDNILEVNADHDPVNVSIGQTIHSIVDFNPYINFDYPLQVGQSICLP